MLNKVEVGVYVLSDKVQAQIAQMGAKVKSSLIPIEKQFDKFATKLNQTTYSIKGMEKGFQALEKAGKASLVSLTAAVAGVSVAFKGVVDYASDVSKVALSTDLTTASVQGWGKALEAVGYSMDQLKEGVGKLNILAGQAFKGDLVALKKFDALGVSIKDSNGQLKNTDRLLSDVTSKLRGISNINIRSMMTASIFGEESGRAITAVTGSRRATTALNMGTQYALPTRTIEGIMEMKQSLSTLSMVFLKEMSPFITVASNFITNVSQKLIDFLNRKPDMTVEEATKKVSSVMVASVGWLAEKWNTTLGNFFEWLNGLNEKLISMIAGVASLIISQLVGINSSLGALSLIAGTLNSLLGLAPLIISSVQMLNPFGSAADREQGKRDQISLITKMYEQNIESLNDKILSLTEIMNDTSKSMEIRTSAEYDLVETKGKLIEAEKKLKYLQKGNISAGSLDVVLKSILPELLILITGGIGGVAKGLTAKKLAGDERKATGTAANVDKLDPKDVKTTMDQLGNAKKASALATTSILAAQGLILTPGIMSLLQGLDNLTKNLKVDLGTIDTKSLEQLILDLFKDVGATGDVAGKGVVGTVAEYIVDPMAEITRLQLQTTAMLSNILSKKELENYSLQGNKSLLPGIAGPSLNGGFKTQLATMTSDLTVPELSTSFIGRMFKVTKEDEELIQRNIDSTQQALQAGVDLFTTYSNYKVQKANQEADLILEAEYKVLNGRMISTRLRKKEEEKLLAEDKKRREEGKKEAKAAQIAAVQMNTATSLGSMWASIFSVPKPMTAQLVLGGITSAMLLANSAIQTAAIAKFANGGIVPGNSYYGDRVPANVNSGEMILNANQQNELFRIANGKGNSKPSISVVINGNVDSDSRAKELESTLYNLYSNNRLEFIKG